MLKRLAFQGVGPSPKLAINFAPRVNLLTGDNGLGKSFFLDAAWWALTRTWAREPILPHPAPTQSSISYAFTKRTKGDYPFTSAYNRDSEQWSSKPSRPPMPGLILYVQVDGGFSVWDPAYNYWKKDEPDRPNSYVFLADEVWEGNSFCEGLLRDWASWQREDNDAFKLLKRALRRLSPKPDEPIEPGALRRLTLSDPKRHPTLKVSHGPDVPVVHASAGMRRIIALAYLLIWTWTRHLEAVELKGEKSRARELIFLVDEIETHLHPQWQRRILPSLLELAQDLTSDSSNNIQLIIATHSPLVLMSLEPHFEPELDAIWELDLTDDGIHLGKSTDYVRGNANDWLTSDTFDLKMARSVEAERAILNAIQVMNAETTTEQELDDCEAPLRESLGDLDEFWFDWRRFRRSKEGS